MGAPTGLVRDLCAVASLRDPSLTLEDDAIGHGECAPTVWREDIAPSLWVMRFIRISKDKKIGGQPKWVDLC